MTIGTRNATRSDKFVCSVYRQLPFSPEIALYPRFRVCRDNRDEQSTVVDLLSDLSIPNIPAA
jgi:hypothetical protein